jgi:hypothetical protein
MVFPSGQTHFTIAVAVSFSLGTLVGSILTLVAEHFFAARRQRKDRFLNAQGALREALMREFLYLQKPVFQWPVNIETSLKESADRIRVIATTYASLLPWRKLRKFQHRWNDFTRFCERKITYQDYVSANWYDDMEPVEDPAKTLKSHVIHILNLLGDKQALL